MEGLVDDGGRHPGTSKGDLAGISLVLRLRSTLHEKYIRELNSGYRKEFPKPLNTSVAGRVEQLDPTYTSIAPWHSLVRVLQPLHTSLHLIQP